MHKVLKTCLAAALLTAAAVPAPSFAAEKKRYISIVLSNPAPGKEAEYNDWYDKVHIPDLLKIPGVKSAQRFKVEGPSKSPQQYMTLFEYETDDLPATRAAITKGVADKVIGISPALAFESVSQTYFAPITSVYTAK